MFNVGDWEKKGFIRKVDECSPKKMRCCSVGFAFYSALGYWDVDTITNFDAKPNSEEE